MLRLPALLACSEKQYIWFLISCTLCSRSIIDLRGLNGMVLLVSFDFPKYNAFC